jgi:putative tricarboxylic transport membrane protein
VALNLPLIRVWAEGAVGQRRRCEVQARRALAGSSEDLGVFVGRPLTVILLLLAIAAFILPSLPALSGWRRERAGAAAED